MSVYTTNYDRLVELSLERSGRKTHVVRSNFDWGGPQHAGAVQVFKIHGCLTQDEATGHKSSMVLTLEDNDASMQYRETIFQRFRLDVSTRNVVVIGASLQDPDIKSVLAEATRAQRSGAPGKLHLVMYQIDAERAEIWRRRGAASVTKGGVNDVAAALVANDEPAKRRTVDIDGTPMSAGLAASTISVAGAGGESHPRLLYFGSSASYADIRAGSTFARDVEGEICRSTALVSVVLGVAGTGKTTLARRVLLSMWEKDGVLPFEHRSQLYLPHDQWVAFESTLRQASKRAVLLVDNCVSHQRQVNQLVRALPDDSALRVVLTAETSAWTIRQKDPRVFSSGRIWTLSRLSDIELGRLADAIDTNKGVRELAEKAFIQKSRPDRIRELRARCKADMFVCLKAVFSSNSIDDILLKEYAALTDPHKDFYKYTCALEAAGAHPHRQMVLRMVGVEAAQVAASLNVLDGLVVEETADEDKGVYLWRSRHEVVASTIAKYKFADSEEVYQLLKDAIESANPSYQFEVRSLRSICTADRGIRSLPDAERRIELFLLVSNVMPQDRVSRHRLIRELIDAGKLGDADAHLALAIKSVGLDPPLQRYKSLIAIRRSRDLSLLLEDRRAVLKHAFAEAESGVRRFADSKHVVFALADVAEEWHSLTGERGWMEVAKLQLARAYDLLLDPDVLARQQRLAVR
ncbi:MAG: SIR2 family protein [Deltaproteobacteria bacterium]|nr:SIR2 family protein [Deltaproteobacteria bacterium]